MKIFYALVLLTFLGLVILGCTESTDQLVTPTDKVSTLNSGGSLEKMGDELHSATGSAHWKFITGQTNVRFSFSAIQHSSGEISGQVNDIDQGYVKLKGTVYDLEVVGNMAKICFTITRGSIMVEGEPLDLAGWICGFIVSDLGNGNNAGDKVSWIDGAPPGTIYPNGMTIEQFNAQNLDDYLTNILIAYGWTLEEYLPAIEYGSVNVR
ncbi:MAG: hypothetical protein IH620_05535 [Ignavibacterium sp.]|nr:hypothetical protein [Ignavibacterium sp.]